MSDPEGAETSQVVSQIQQVVPDPPLEQWRERLELLLTRPTEPGRWAIVAVVVVIAVVIGVLLVRRQTPAPELSLPMAGSADEAAIAPSTTTTLVEIVVHAAGALHRPGVYRLFSGVRVVDLIERAGGPTDDAQVDALNLAAPLVDGSRIYVPRHGEVALNVQGSGIDSSGSSSSESGVLPTGVLLDLNTATAAQLEQLPGVGPSTARSILQERERKGRFDSVEDLLDVRGIGEAKLSEIRPLVRV